MSPIQDKPIAVSDAENIGNIGFPESLEGIDHFVKMFETTGRFTKQDLELFRKAIGEAALRYLSEQKNK